MKDRNTTLLLDIMVGGRFYKQLRYDGPYEIVDGVTEYDRRLIEHFVESKLPSLRTRKYRIQPTEQRR